MALGSRARYAVDELDAFGFEARQFALEIDGAQGDVVQALPTPLEEATHGGIGSEGLEELDRADERDVHTLRFEDLDLGTGFARQEFKETAAFLDGSNGDPHVVEWVVCQRRSHEGPVPEGAVLGNGIERS